MGKTMSCLPPMTGNGLLVMTGGWFRTWFYPVTHIKASMYPLVNVYSLLLKMAIEIVSFPIENGGSFYSYVWKITIFNG